MHKKNKNIEIYVLVDHNSNMNEGYTPTYDILGVYDKYKLAKAHFDRIADAWTISPRYNRLDKDEERIEVWDSGDPQTTFDELSIIKVNLNQEYYD